MTGADKDAAGPDAQGSHAAPEVGVVRGERAESAVTRERSIQSRASNLLAGGLTMVLGLGALTWYYSNAATKPDRARQREQLAAKNRAQGEMQLPPLGRIEPPLLQVQAPTSGPMLGADPQPLPILVQSAAQPPGLASTSPVASAARTRTPEQLAVQRRLAGAVFVHAPDSSAASASPVGSSSDWRQQLLQMSQRQIDQPQPSDSGTPSQDGALAVVLRPTVTQAVSARVLPSKRFLLPKGAFVDCTLETAIDSTLPGMTTCVTATDTFGADGSVVLLERGTKLVGETRGQVQQGSARLFVLWTEARTPTGVVVPLDSPGTDELGRAGLAGFVNRHFWQRFGAAILVSTIDGVVQSAARSSAGANSGGGGVTVVNPAGTQDILTEVLRGTVNIAPTVVKSNGDRIQVLVARDIDFRSVYELRPASTAR